MYSRNYKKFYLKYSASLLGCTALSARFPHEKSIRSTSDLDNLLGSKNRRLPNLPNKFGGGYAWVRKQTAEFLCTFTKQKDGTIRLYSVDGETQLYRVLGDVLRYCMHGEDDVPLKDVDLVPESENDTHITFLVSIEYKIVELL